MGSDIVRLEWWPGRPRRSPRRKSKDFQLARQYGLLTLSDLGYTLSYSYLHSLAPGQIPDPSKVMWSTWVEQEKRVRTMYMCYLLSCALNIYFNMPAAFESAEICDSFYLVTMPLGTPKARSLVLMRWDCMTLADTMRILHDETIPLQHRSTNAYSKFVLIHALHTEICRLQKQRSFDISIPQTPGVHPTHPQTTILFRSIANALERWKVSWDEDMVLQYPVIPGKPGRRYGFCRDGSHFYFLGRAFLQPNRTDDWRLPPDTRPYQSLRGLSQVVNWARVEVLSRGEETGSGFDFDIGDYGVGTLEMDMRRLFPPLGLDAWVR